MTRPLHNVNDLLQLASGCGPGASWALRRELGSAAR
jgi:hypothetical protein